MKLDTESQRRSLLSLIASSTVPGNAIDEAFALKRAIETAEIDNEDAATEPAGKVAS